MALTRLPQHVLQNIISLTISDCDLSSSLKLRLVSRQVNREVQHAIFDRDEKQLMKTLEWGYCAFSDRVAFRYLRGFILRRDHDGRQLRFWQQLQTAISILIDREANERHISSQTLENPADRFLDICSSDQNSAFERALAMICDVLFVVSYDACFFPIQLINPQWYEDSGLWPLFKDKTPEFWVMAVAARWNDMGLYQSSIERIRNTPNIRRSVIASNLAESMRIPAQARQHDMIKLVLGQQEVNPSDIKRRILPLMRTIPEAAIRSGHVSIVETLLSCGLNLVESPLEYILALGACSDSNMENSTRKTILELLLNLTDQWQSESVTKGLVESLCRKGDIGSVQMVTDRYQESGSDHSRYDWTWSDSMSASSALYESILSHSFALVRFILDKKETLLPIWGNSFSDSELMGCLELSIRENQTLILTELLKEPLSQSVSRERLFTYAALRGDPQQLSCLYNSVDLHKKLHGHLLRMHRYQPGSTLSNEMRAVEEHKSLLLRTPGLLSFGAFILILALKAYKVENAKYLLEHGVRIGRRYVEITRNYQSRSSALLTANDDNLFGKGTLLGITWKMHHAESFRKMLNQGVSVLPKTFVMAKFDREQFQQEKEKKKLQKSSEAGAQPPKKQGILSRIWERSLFFSYATSSYMHDIDAVVLLEIEVPAPENPFMTSVRTSEMYERYDQMVELLWKYRQPSVYFDDASLRIENDSMIWVDSSSDGDGDGDEDGNEDEQ